MAQDVVVETNCGKIRGLAENEVKVFKGVRYAESPEGEGRFAPPRNLQPWAGVRDAFEFGDRAMQDDNAFALPPALLKLFAGRELPPMSENCLVLNVWTPRGQRRAQTPGDVLVPRRRVHRRLRRFALVRGNQSVPQGRRRCRDD
jgi:para-nitrobenzyl esterase